MLYRFREAQAAELGLAQKGDKRPRMASACKSLRDCERWRGEILREISRKVSKIQDAGLTDYEVRDLNDEINKLMREKRHWENQIVALGGANYRRNVPMLDEDGKEVPGTRGYKSSRCKGAFPEKQFVPHLLLAYALLRPSPAEKEDEENRVLAHYKKFLDQGPAYFGDHDEDDEELLQYEIESERAEWESAYQNLKTSLELPDDSQAPKIPRPDPIPLSKIMAQLSQTGGDTAMTEGDGNNTDSTSIVHPPMLSVLSPTDLQHPKMPSKEEMEGVLLALRKRALLEQYLGVEWIALGLRTKREFSHNTPAPDDRLDEDVWNGRHSVRVPEHRGQITANCTT
ncbi:pre-mRNA-splicing factor ISY1 [Rhizoctonia solani AG-1 IA]|uniref:Pre-mRNA-splicing factor ISY1 n=1 Tax=Thanatephorus cucumeris (strain AG1-IA) TaxID=983506 RepID=L8X9R5_THACA|nr:pre-mRNA-splicing factor ISY1 [Rhizoctonia solani AG-1 IA]